MAEDDIESLLRRTLSERAGHAPNSGMLEQRTLAAIRRGPARRNRPIWLVPVSVAASVLVVVGATVGGVALVNNLNSGNHTSVGATGRTTLATTTGAPETTSSPTATATPTPTSTSDGGTGTDSAPTKSAQGSPVGGAVPPGFQVSDLTFVSADEGWALGTAGCTQKPCTSIARTTDGGTSWRGIPAPRVGLRGVDGCTSTCVSGIRFATSSVGYVFGPDVLFMTINGGTTWNQIEGGATALEISHGNVLRVSPQNGCSPPGCSYTVQLASIGGTTWHTVLTANTPGMSTDAGLVRAGTTAFVQVYGHTAGGASSADSALFSSVDNGQNWTARHEACPKLPGATGEVDATALTPAPFGSVTVLCQPRGAGGLLPYLATSSKNGAAFVPSQPFALGAPIGAISASVVLAQGQSGTSNATNLLRSTNGGKTWVVAAKGGPTTRKGSAGFLGFENTTTGRWVQGGNPSSVWTTTNAGATWTKYTFSG